MTPDHKLHALEIPLGQHPFHISCHPTTERSDDHSQLRRRVKYQAENLREHRLSLAAGTLGRMYMDLKRTTIFSKKAIQKMTGSLQLGNDIES